MAIEFDVVHAKFVIASFSESFAQLKRLFPW